ncbi:hypothetical protein CANCADRAFT_121654 [Tortispora caseinolytica NRRL Y-17796]|uniref:PSI domain-containing protein n=1 Tax=Tortispora caseinolytica NRRL Y-17796 TaxID=767744 RepID=A0A1E4THK9_9ASCO|nr:hypothetical protein CANCADRAFT_121654 [Tortispora caseinolytica NRRL Y-17796]
MDNLCGACLKKGKNYAWCYFSAKCVKIEAGGLFDNVFYPIRHTSVCSIGEKWEMRTNYTGCSTSIGMYATAIASIILTVLATTLIFITVFLSVSWCTSRSRRSRRFSSIYESASRTLFRPRYQDNYSRRSKSRGFWFGLRRLFRKKTASRGRLLSRGGGYYGPDQRYRPFIISYSPGTSTSSYESQNAGYNSLVPPRSPIRHSSSLISEGSEYGQNFSGYQDDVLDLGSPSRPSIHSMLNTRRSRNQWDSPAAGEGVRVIRSSMSLNSPSSSIPEIYPHGGGAQPFYSISRSVAESRETPQSVSTLVPDDNV